MAKGGWLILFTPGSCNRPPARQRGPFKARGALRKHGYFPQLAIPTAPLSRAHDRSFNDISPFGRMIFRKQKSPKQTLRA